MEVVKLATATDLSVNSITALVPAGSSQLLADDAKVGVQPLNTFILGSLQDTFEKVIRKGVIKKRLILREVLSAGTEGKQVDVIVYGDYANNIEDILKTVVGSSKLWVVFTKASIVSYPGYGNGWCKNCLRVGGTGMSEALVTFVTEFRPPAQNARTKMTPLNIVSPERSLPSQLTMPDIRNSRMPVNSGTTITKQRTSQKAKSYENINSLSGGRKFELFAVVNEVVKPPTLTARQSHHMLLGLVDPSCLQIGSQRPDLLLHIFINDKVSNKPLGDLPGGIASGDVIRIRDMYTELYQVENKLHGKVYSAAQVVKFAFERDSVSPITYSSSYVFTEEDCKIATNLHQWWNQVKQQLHAKTQENQGYVNDEYECPEASVEELNSDMLFFLFCQVVEVRPVTKLCKEVVILRVRDGTSTTVHTHQCNMADATQDLLSQTDTYSAVGSKLIDINVLTPTEDAKQLESGDFALLKYVHCLHMNPEGNTENCPPLFELLMSDPRCTIKKISPSHSETRKIMKRLGCRNAAEAIADAQENIEGNVPAGRSTPMRSPLKPSPNRINTQPLSPQRLHRSTSNLGSFAHPNTPSRMPHPVSGSPLSHGSRNMSARSSPHLPIHTDSLERAMEGFHSEELGSDMGTQHCSPGRKSQSPRLMHPLPALDQDMSRIEFPADLPTSTQRTTSDIHTKDSVPGSRGSGDCSVMYSASKEDLGLPPISPSLSSTSNDHRSTDIPRISPTHSLHIASTAKRRLPMIEESSERDGCLKKVAKIPAAKTVITECSGEFTNSTLKDLKAESQPGVIYRVTGVIKALYIYPDGQVCQSCEGKLCLHDWVWGLCVKCGKTHSASTLRDFFSERDLTSLTALPCVHCIENHTKSKGKGKTEETKLKESGSSMTLRKRGKKGTAQDINNKQTEEDQKEESSSKPADEEKSPSASTSKASEEIPNGQETAEAEDNENLQIDPPASVAPVLRLKVCISNPEDGSELDVLLNGDNAKGFFGMEPSFDWVVRKPDKKIRTLIRALLKDKNTLDFGIERVKSANGCISYVISKTVLRLKE